jgi:peroxiredoxin
MMALIAAVCSFGPGPLAAPLADDPVAVGAPAPSWTLLDSKGLEHSLAGFKGKFVVMEWTNHECPYVVKHYSTGNMQALQTWATGQGVVWLSVVSSAPGKQGHVDGPRAEAVMADKGHKCTAMLLDPTGETGRAYGAKTTPHMFVIDPEGRIIYMGGIDDRPTPDPADVPGARNHVRAALEEALAGRPVSVPKSQPYGCSVKY